MPKQVWKIERFEGGINSGADPRDIKENELAEATDIAVDNVGLIKTMGSNIAHDAGTNNAVITAGYGIHYFSHDRTYGNINLTGTHTGSANQNGSVLQPMVNSVATFDANVLIGGTIHNTTDGSNATISGNSATTITGGLSGGTDSDWDNGDAYTIVLPALETGDDYLLFADADGAANIDVYSSETDNWGIGRIDLGSTTGMKPCFYDADGAVRISDGNFGAANKNKWFGYIKQTHFNGVSPGGATDVYDRWYEKDVNLAKPTRGLANLLDFADAQSGTNDTTIVAPLNSFEESETQIELGDYIAISTDGSNAARIISSRTNDTTIVTVANSGNWSGEAIKIFPGAGLGWNIQIQPSGAIAGTWAIGSYEIGTTFIYQGNQESPVYENSGTWTAMTAGNGWAVEVFATSPYDPFITGGRAYIRKKDSDDPWILLLDISLRNGIRLDLTSTFTAWSLQNAAGSGDAGTNIYCHVTAPNIKEPSPWTYEAINGYGPDEIISIGSVGEGFKTAVVANRQVYIGNVRRENKDGETVTEGDAMYKSMPGKFDTFPIVRKIEVSVQDGDEIVKLEEYADRILQFKKQKVHIINIAQDIEFLEDTYMHKGIDVPGAVCKTDFGIAWVNDNGCYLYNGKNVINLLEKGGLKIIDERAWRTFIGTTPLIGYVPKERQLIVVKTAGSGAVGDIFLYDMVTQSWVEGDSKFTDSVDKTNLITDWNQDLVHAHTSDTGTFLKWDDTAVASSTFAFKTKDIDFGQPSVRKKVYKAYVSYKGDGRTIDIQYSVNGDNNTTAPFFRTTADGSSDKTNSDSTPLLGPSDIGTDDWVLAELVPVSPINNVYSFQLIFDGTSVADFEINDISIIYRTKNIK